MRNKNSSNKLRNILLIFHLFCVHVLFPSVSIFSFCLGSIVDNTCIEKKQNGQQKIYLVNLNEKEFTLLLDALKIP